MELPVIPAKGHREIVGDMPIDILLAAARDPKLDIELRLAAASKAAPYFHARVSVGPPKAAFEMSDFELDAAIKREKGVPCNRTQPWPTRAGDNRGRGSR